jgi:hypothetical protein
MLLVGAELSRTVEADRLIGILPTEPSPALLEILSDLAVGSTIGVGATAEELAGEEVDGMAFTMPEVTGYWRKIIDTCQDAGHKVVYLESFDTQRRIARFNHAAEIVKSFISYEGFSGLIGPDPNKKRELSELAYAFTVASQRAFIIEREDTIFSNMSNPDLDVSIIGLALSDYFMLNPDNPVRDRVDQYWQSRSPESNFVPLYQPYGDAPLMAGKPQQLVMQAPDPQVLLEKESITRMYNAVTTGRILPDEPIQPTWIGSWTPNCRPEGLFEVRDTMRDQTTGFFDGEIEDCLGGAACRGKYRRDGISFTKIYTRSLGAAFREPLRYIATDYEELGELFHGQYVLLDTTGGLKVYGDFIIKQGSVLYEPIDIENVDIDELLP